MILKEKINNCTYLRIVNNSIFCDIDNVCYMDWKPTQIPDDTIIFCNQNGNYFYLENKLYEISSEGISRKIIDYSPSSYIEPIEDYYLIFNRISRKEKYYQLIDKNKETIWLDKINWGYKILNNSLFLFENDNKLSLINLLTKSPIWSYSLPEGFKIEGKIYLYDNILVVNQIDEQSCSIMVGLDILTGKKLWENKVSLIHYQQKNDFLYGFASNTFGDNVFSKINIKTGEVFEKSFENFAKQVASHLATIHNDNLYFSAYKIGEIGIIDLQKQEIIQEFSLNLEKGVGIGAPVVTEDKIYILDSLNTLHIFKK